MRISRLVSICATIVVVHGGQIPMRMPGGTSTPSIETNAHLWDLKTSRPAPNSTNHLVFSTVSSLLQHWPNTRYRNGHTLVAATVPQGTLLYHGTVKSQIPTVPEWTAMDPEHSYLFCRGKGDTGCWHLTLMTTRPLKVLYFDGNSAAKMRGGSMDSQDVLLWGEVKPDWTNREPQRIKELCEWGKEFGLDGYVRMEMDFEIMLCDFTAGVEPVSFTNLVTQRPPWRNLTEVETHDNFPALWITVLETGSWHNHYPGDTRIRPDLTTIVSFYDTLLVPSLIPHRFGKERLLHRLEGISQSDSVALQKRLREVLSDKHSSFGSGVDWGTLIRVIIDRYADRLELVQHFMITSTESTLERAQKAQFHLRWMLTPYILHSAVPMNWEDKANISWAVPVFKHCATTHTKRITSNSGLASKLTASENLILDAVKYTNKEICRVITGMWAEGAIAGLDHLLIHPSSAPMPSDELNAMLLRWASEIDALMRWLDWSVWVKCRPACGFEEMCYLPTWPFLRPSNPPHHPPRPQKPEWPDQDDESEWLDPKPKCIRRVQPYDL